MEYKNDWLDGWVGRDVLIECVTGFGRDAEDSGRLVGAPGKAMYGNLSSLAVVCELLGYDAIGIIVRNPEKEEDEGGEGHFVPWGAVLSVHGLYWTLSEG